MSAYDDARVAIFVADYGSDEGTGKINAIGVGFRVVGLSPEGLTAPQTVIVLVDIPAQYVNTEFPISLDLRRADTGELVQVIGPNGSPDTLRVQQMVRVTPPNIQGAYLPPDFGGRVQMVAAFPMGLQLQAGVTYNWHFEIEGQHRQDWTVEFHVVGPPPQPVFGGPATPPPAGMPKFGEYVVPPEAAKKINPLTGKPLDDEEPPPQV